MKEIDKFRLSSEPAYKRLKEMGKASCPPRKTIAQTILELEQARKEQGSSYVTIYVETTSEDGKKNVIPLHGQKDIIEKLIKKNGLEIVKNMVIKNKSDFDASKKKSSTTIEPLLLK